MFRKSEALSRHQSNRQTMEQQNQSGTLNFQQDIVDGTQMPLENNQRSQEEVADGHRLRLSSFPNELFQSEGFIEDSNKAQQQPGDKSVANTSRLNLAEDDLDAYYEQEGKAFFGSTQSAKDFEEQLIGIL